MIRSYSSFLILSFAVLSFSCGQKATTASTPAPAPKNDVAAQQTVQQSVQQTVQISPAGTKSAEPGIAADDKGTLYVAWVDHSDENANLFLQTFGTDGKPSGDRIKINPEGTKVKAWYGDSPTVNVGRDGSLYVAWNRASAGKGNDLVVSVSHDGGKTFADAVKVNDDTEPASHGMHSLAVDGNGRIYLAWLDERNIKKAEHTGSSHHDGGEPNSEVYFSFSEDGGKTFAQNKRLATEVCPCCKTTLLVANDRVYTAWRQVLPGEFRHVAVAHSTDGGRTFSEGVVVSDDKWQISACPVSGAALSMSEDGSLVAAWYTAGSDGQPGVYTSRSTDGGATFSPRVLVSNDGTNGTPVILNDRSFVLPAKDGKIMFQTAGEGSRAVALSEGFYPVAATSRDSKFVCFVRKDKDGSSVWMSRLGS